MKIGVNSRIFLKRKTGIPVYIKELYTQLQNDYPQNEYRFFQTKREEPLGKILTVDVPQNSLGDALFDNFLVNGLIRQEKVDIFHGPAHIIPLIKVPGVKYLVTIHDLSFLIFPQHYPVNFQLYYKYLVGNSLKNADLIVAVSQNTKQDIIQFYRIPEGKITVIHSGISDVFFHTSKQKPLINTPYFLSLTTHPKRKNTPAVLKAFAVSKTLKNEYKCVIVGLVDNRHREMLENLIEKWKLVGKVIYLGFVSDNKLLNLYQNAKFFVYPSLYEGFGFPVLEAMICGCPVITSNVSSLPELVPNKKWLVDPYNYNDLAEKINELIKLPEKEHQDLITTNYNFAKRFTWQKTAREMNKVFESLIE